MQRTLKHAKMPPGKLAEVGILESFKKQINITVEFNDVKLSF